MLILNIAIFLAGLALVVWTLLGAIRSFVLPRSVTSPITRAAFIFMRFLFDVFLKVAKSYEDQDRLMAYYAPVTLLILPPTWLFLVTLGYTAMFWATGVRPLGEAFLLSGSSILTLGFATAETLFQRVLIFTEATIGLILVALLIAYLPTMYSAFARRETAVTLLDVRAGNPPSAVEMLGRLYRIGHFQHLDDIWEYWETWFAELEESHTSLPALVFFRSPVPEYSWVTASGTVLDAASLLLSVVDISAPSALNPDLPRNPKAALCIRAGYLALRRIADFFRISYNETPTADDPISISRDEFDEACAQLAEAGIPLRPDLEIAWRDFKGWRVNYDTVLISLSYITMSPRRALVI